MSDAPERISLVQSPMGGWRLWDSTSSREKPDARYVRADIAAAARAEGWKAAMETAAEKVDDSAPATQDWEGDIGRDVCNRIAAALRGMKEGQHGSHD